MISLFIVFESEKIFSVQIYSVILKVRMRTRTVNLSWLRQHGRHTWKVAGCLKRRM